MQIILNFTRTLCFILGFLALLAGSLAQAETQKIKRAFIIDTDAGIDDVIALTYFLKHPGVQVKAITIETNGVTHQGPAMKNIQNLLTFLGHSSVPLACGPSQPLFGKARHFSSLVMQINDTLANTAIPVSQAPLSLPCQPAEELLISLLTQTTEAINILALGPLTNIAKLVQQRPDLVKKIGTIYLMGGAIKVRGNIDDVIPSPNKKAEWNIYLDAAAAERVFHSGIKIVLVPLDLTNQVPLNSGFDAEIKKGNSATAIFIYDLLANNRKSEPPDIWYFWDPLAAVIAAQPEATYTELPLSVSTLNEAQWGATLIDKKRGAPIQVVLAIDKQKFTASLTEGLIN